MSEADPQNAAMKGSLSGCFRPYTHSLFYNGEELRKAFWKRDQKSLYRGFVLFLGAFILFCLCLSHVKVESTLENTLALICWFVLPPFLPYRNKNFHQWLDSPEYCLLRPLSVFCFSQQNSLSGIHSHCNLTALSFCCVLCAVIDGWFLASKGSEWSC